MGQNNQFTDRFKFLNVAAAKTDELSKQISAFLSKYLPQRVLSKTNIFELTQQTVQDISTLNMFYIEDSLIENNINVAQNPISVRGLAELSGHSSTRVISAYGSIELNLLPGLSLSTPTIIFDNTVIRCISNGLSYSMINPDSTVQVNTDNNSVVLDIIEGIWKEQTLVGDGTSQFIIHLNDLDTIENSHISVSVNSVLYSQFDRLYDMTSTSKGFLLRNGVSNQVDIIFGDGIHGVQVTESDTVLVKYLTSNGELGNIADISDSVTFEIISGLYDAEGDEINSTDNITIKYLSGFALGSYGEHIETTRMMAGHNSRSFVFARPENLKAYLSRLSILSHIDIWTEGNDLIFNVLALPNVMNKIRSYSDYLYLSDTDLKLTEAQRTAISEYINTSGSQLSSSEIVYRDPVFDKYAIFVYVDASYTDVNVFKSKIFDTISKYMLEQTFADVDLNYDMIISKSAIINDLYDIPEVNRLSMTILSERNENAKIQGYYTRSVEINTGSVIELTTETVIVQSGDNPNLGFSDIGDIVTDTKFNIPVIRSGFYKYNNTNPAVLLDKPIYIFKSIRANWQEI